MGVAVAIFYTATTSLFLISFDRTMLPKAYIAGGLVVYALGIATRFVQRKVQFARLSNGLTYFLMLSVTGLVIAFQFSGIVWLIFCLFVWNRVFVFVNGITFWSTAAKVFDIQQAKRLYGLISTGEVVSSILSFFSVPLLLQFMTTDQLLYIVAVAVVGCILMMRLIVVRFADKLSVTKPVQPEAAKVPEDDTRSWRTFLANPYYFLVFLLAMMPVVGLFFVDFMFAVESKNVFPDKELLAGFLGTFFGFCALLEILIKTVLYNKVISKYGLTLGIALLPITLLFSVGLAVGYGTFYGTTALFFAFIVLSRFFMSSVRKSVNEPSFQILMQPISGAERANVQSRIEGGPKALGNIVPGVLLLILTSVSFIGTVQIAAFFLLILAGWVYLSLKVQPQYRAVLRATLARPALDPTTGNDPKLPLPPAESEDTDTYAALAGRVRAARKTVALNYEHNSFEFIEKLANSVYEHDRVLAARMLGESGRYYAFRHLARLIDDEALEVRNAALEAAGSARSPDLWPLLIAHLDSDASHQAAAYGLLVTSEGGGRDTLVRTLGKSFERAAGNTRLQVRLLWVIRQIGGIRAIRFLRTILHHPDAIIRDEVYDSLACLDYRVTITERPGIVAETDARIGLLVWLLAAQRDLEAYPADAPVQAALEAEKRRLLPKLFSLLTLLPGSQRFDDISDLVLANHRESRGYLLEVMNMTLPEAWKGKLLPIFEDLPLAEKLKRTVEHFPQQNLSAEARLKDMVNHHFSLVSVNLRAAALHELSRCEGDCTLTMAAHAVAPEAPIAEIALHALYRYNRPRYDEIHRVMVAQDDQFHLHICAKIQVEEELEWSDE